MLLGESTGFSQSTSTCLNTSARGPGFCLSRCLLQSFQHRTTVMLVASVAIVTDVLEQICLVGKGPWLPIFFNNSSNRSTHIGSGFSRTARNFRKSELLRLIAVNEVMSGQLQYQRGNWSK